LPFVDIDRMNIYVKDPNDPLYGQIGEVVISGWSHGHNISAVFPDGRQVDISNPDNNSSVSVWRKLQAS
jgi:hypothetical protein